MKTNKLNHLVVMLPCCFSGSFAIVKETEKAVQLACIQTGAPCWLPKAALVYKAPTKKMLAYDPNGEQYYVEYRLANWFKPNEYQKKWMSSLCDWMPVAVY
jgi:hypothetical protein